MKSKFSLSIISLIAFFQSAQAQWTRQSTYPLADSNRIFYAIKLSPDPKVASSYLYDLNDLTADPEIMVATQGGKKLTKMLQPTPINKNIIGDYHVVDSLHYYAITGTSASFSSIFFKETVDGGKNWITVPKIYTNAASFPNGIRFWDAKNGTTLGDPVGGYYEVYNTADGGKTWIRVPKSTGLTPLGASEFAIIGRYATSNDGGYFAPTSNDFGKTFNAVLVSQDKGLTWERRDFPANFYDTGTLQFMGMNAGTKNDMSIIGAFKTPNGDLAILNYASHDGCKTWKTPIDVGLAYEKEILLEGIASIEGTNILSATLINAADDSLFIGISKDDGKTWNYQYTKGYKMSDDAAALSQAIETRLHFTKFASTKDGWMAAPDGIIRYKGNLLDNKEVLSSIVLSLNTYPNPSIDLVNISFTAEKETPTEVAIYDIQGRKVASLHNGSLFTGEHSFQWQPTISGNYFVKVITDNHIVSRKIVVQK